VLERLIPARRSTLSTVALASTFALHSLHAAAAASGNAYWRPILTIACSPLDAGQTDVMIDRHDEHWRIFGHRRPAAEQELKKVAVADLLFLRYLLSGPSGASSSTSIMLSAWQIPTMQTICR